MKTENKESNLEKRARFGNSIKNNLKKGFETAYKSCKSVEAQFLFYFLLFTAVSCIGANEFRKAGEYTGNNPLYQRVQTINNQLNAKTTFQYKDIGQLCGGIYQKQEQVQELFAEKNSITQLPAYQKQAEKIKQARTLRKIGWGIPLFVGMGGALSVLGAFAFYSTTEYESNKEKK